MSVRAAARSVSLPGQAQPVAVYALARARRRPRRTRGIEGRRAELVGRGEEMDALAEMLDALQAGTGGVALLAGEAGVGKSRLVEECENLAANAEASPLWLEGRCLEMTAGTPYAPFAGMLRGSLETGTSPGNRSTGGERPRQAAIAGRRRPAQRRTARRDRALAGTAAGAAVRRRLGQRPLRRRPATGAVPHVRGLEGAAGRAGAAPTARRRAGGHALGR